MLRFGPAAPHLARTMPWPVLLAGCAVGLSISLVEHLFARPSQSPTTIIIVVRVAFVPLVAASAFLTSDPLDHDLATALPAPAWLSTVMSVIFALPILGLSAWLQLALTASALRISEPATAHLPWLSLVVELGAWSVFAIAAATSISRTRWNELAGAIAVPVALAFVGVLAFAPLRLLPAAPSPTGLASPEHAAWLRSDWSWCALGLAAALVTLFAGRDRWRRL